MAETTPDTSESAHAQSKMLELFFDLGIQLLRELGDIAHDPTRVGDADRLLGRNVGVIAGFNSLSAALARILGRAPAQATSNIDGDVPDDAEIQQRIAAELDRIAARTRAVAGDPEDGTDRGRTPQTNSDVETVAGERRSGSA